MLLFMCDYADFYAPVCPFMPTFMLQIMPIRLNYAKYAQIMQIMLKLCRHAKLCNYAKLCSPARRVERGAATGLPPTILVI